jgi:hypothetical protein
MLKKGALVCMLLVAVWVPAHADSVTDYTITFTTASGVPTPMSGSFTYDSTNPSFSNFLVVWNGTTIDLTAAANSPFDGATVNSGTGCSGESATPSYGFMLMSQSLTGCSVGYSWLGVLVQGSSGFDFVANIPGQAGANDQIYSATTSFTTIEAFGGFTITATPEPTSGALLGCGLLTLAWTLRRKCLA